MKKIRFDILTLFPETFSSVLGTSILKRAIEAGHIELLLHDIRQFADGRHRTVDDKPYGGGAGMVIKAEPVIAAVRDVETVGKRCVVLMSASGETLTQKVAKELANFDQLVLVAGHYEGVDQRAIDAVVDREISIGDYVTTGGELPALIVSEVVSRFVEGVLGNADSSKDESFEDGLLEYPHYTRPAEFGGMKVPEVLLSGDQKKIAEWRSKESENRTRKMRPDLI